MPNDLPDYTSQVRVNLIGGLSGANLGDVAAAVLNPDAATEIIVTSGNPQNPDGALASFKAVAGQVIAQVGALGAFLVGSNAAVNPAFGQAPTAGNFLLAAVSAVGATPTTATAGWSQAVLAAGLGGNLAFWIKPNAAGGDAAPQFTAAGGTAPMMAQLAEFSGVATAAPTDRTATNLGSQVGAQVNVAMAGIDVAFGDLVALITGWNIGGGGTATFSQTFNNGAAAVHGGDSGGVSRTIHTSFTYAIVPAAAVAQPVGMQDWAYDVLGNNAPATGAGAGVTLAGVAGKAYTLAHIEAALVQVSGALSAPLLKVTDGAIVIWQTYMGISATPGDRDRVNLSGLAIKGTVGANMVISFSAGAAGTAQSVSVGAYLR